MQVRNILKLAYGSALCLTLCAAHASYAHACYAPACYAPACYFQDAAAVNLPAPSPTPSQASPAPDPDRPLPDIPTLMRQVENHQRKAEQVQKDYIFHSIETAQELDGHGATKKTEVTEYNVFWIDGVPVRKLVRKDGRDLTADEARKESDRVDKEAAKAKDRRAKEDAKGRQSDPRGDDEVTVSRLLELGSFTNPRRTQIMGRDTIVVDYSGDPQAKTRNSFEAVIRDITGTIWVDEQDHVITKLQGHFVNAFKIGGGLLVSIHQGTSFAMQQARVNGEVWLPQHIEGHGEARALLFFKFNGSLTVEDSDYRKFKSSSIILPSANTTPPENPPAQSPPAAQPTPGSPQ